jgi:hypothetical protein
VGSLAYANVRSALVTVIQRGDEPRLHVNMSPGMVTGAAEEARCAGPGSETDSTLVPWMSKAVR